MLGMNCSWYCNTKQSYDDCESTYKRGDLDEYLKRKGALKRATGLRFAMDIARNILRDDSGHLNVADFGVSKLLKVENRVKEDRPLTCHDTSCRYVAPEVFRNEEYDTQVDVFLDEECYMDIDSMWNLLEHNIKEVSKEVLGESKGNGPSSKDTSWWNQEVKQAIKTKRECYKVLGKCSSDENYERYKKARTEAKKAVRNAISKVNKELYARLDTKEGEKDIYKLARMREKKTRDIGKVKCVKDTDQRVLVQDKEIKERWRSYFDTLFNGHQEQDIGNLSIPSNMINREFKRRIQKGEVTMALKKMGSKKAEGPVGRRIDTWMKL
ncbi:hypothetical protein OROMI_018814 [Orobanche minor]